jgi:D-alanyl-D-alanine carboxypeptidase
MRRRAVLLLVAGLAFGCSSTDRTADAPASTTTSLPPIRIESAELRHMLQALVDDTESPGGVLGVQVRGAEPVIVAVGADPVTKQRFQLDDPFRVASVTKTFVGALALRLVEQGRLGLDEPVATYVPEWPRGDEITVRHLLTHTSGIPPMGGDAGKELYLDEIVEFTYTRPARHVTPNELLAFVARRPLLFEPGRGTEYSNTNTILLGEVTARVTGESVGRQLRRELLEPLGLRATRYAAEEPAEWRHGLTIVGTETEIDSSVIDYTADTSARGASYAMVSTVPDLLTWGQVFLRDRTVVDRALTDEAFTIGSFGTGLGVIGFAEGHGFCVFDGCPPGADFRGVGGPGQAPGASTVLVHDRPTDTTVALVVARDSIPGLDELVQSVLELIEEAAARGP